MGSDFVVIGTRSEAAECQCADSCRMAAELRDLVEINQTQNIRLVARINKQAAAIGAMLPALRLVRNELGGEFQPYDVDSFLPDHILCQIAPAIAAGEAAL